MKTAARNYQQLNRQRLSLCLWNLSAGMLVCHQNQRMTHALNNKYREFESARERRQSVAILATGRSALTILRRVKQAGYSAVSVFDSANALLTACKSQGFSRVLAILEPELFTRDALHQLDELGVITVGVVAHNRHRSWSQLLPLCETVWLFALGPAYRTRLDGYSRQMTRVTSD